MCYSPAFTTQLLVSKLHFASFPEISADPDRLPEDKIFHRVWVRQGRKYTAAWLRDCAIIRTVLFLMLLQPQTKDPSVIAKCCPSTFLHVHYRLLLKTTLSHTDGGKPLRHPLPREAMMVWIAFSVAIPVLTCHPKPPYEPPSSAVQFGRQMASVDSSSSCL